MSYISLCCLGGGSGRRDVCWCSTICRICRKEVKLIRLLGRSGNNCRSSIYCVILFHFDLIGAPQTKLFPNIQIPTLYLSTYTYELGLLPVEAGYFIPLYDDFRTFG